MLAEAEVAELEVTVCTNYEVIWLEIPVDVVEAVDTLNGKDGFCDVKLRKFLTQNVFFYEERHKVTSLHKLHDQIEVFVVLERTFELDNPRVISERQKVSFCPHVLDLVLVNHQRLIHFLDRDDFVCLLVSAHPHLSERTSADDGEGFEVCDLLALPLEAKVLALLVEDLLFNYVLFLLAQIHALHLFGEVLPSFSTLSFFVFSLRIFVFNESFGALNLFLGPPAELWSMLVFLELLFSLLI